MMRSLWKVTVLALPLMWSAAALGADGKAECQAACKAKCKSQCATECTAECKAGCEECPACQTAEHDGGTLSTLLQIRQLFGDPLAGTSLAECCDDSTFEAALSLVADAECAAECALESAAACAAEQLPPPAIAEVPPGVAPTAKYLPRALEWRPTDMPAPWVRVAEPPLPVPVIGDDAYAYPYHVGVLPPPCPALVQGPMHVYAVAEEHAKVKPLRQSARGLEMVASDLEDIGKYAEADELRAVAAKLRQQARDVVVASAPRIEHPEVPASY